MVICGSHGAIVRTVSLAAISKSSVRRSVHPSYNVVVKRLFLGLVLGLAVLWVGACIYACVHPVFDGYVLIALLAPPAAMPVLIGMAAMWAEWRHRPVVEVDASPKRRGDNGCMECGYNLTGNVSGRCPECGKPTL